MTPQVDYTDLTVLITGGTGSFGSTMVRHLLTTGAREVRIISRDEDKQHQMRQDIDDPRLQFHVGDIRHPRSIRNAMRGVDLVFHAAALKQVPSCEFHPEQAVMTNVMGSINVIDAARGADVGSVVCLSTDKAVLPVNAMGMTKALMEKVVQATAHFDLADDPTTVSTVRYGNVLCSRGSVVPIFMDQAMAGRPLTVTDPDMTRFVLPLSDVVGLVEFAFFNAQVGDLFVRRVPAATMGDIARAINELFGNTAGIDVIGTRHGEKLFETLATASELARAELLGEYIRVPMDARGTNYNASDRGAVLSLDEDQDYHSHNCERMDLGQVVELLGSLPEVKQKLSET